MQEAARIRRPIVLLALAAALGLASAARGQPTSTFPPTSRPEITDPSPADGAARGVAPRPTTRNETGYPAPWHIIKWFDFDEAKEGNESGEPMYWFRFKGREYPDFPRYASGVWDRQFGYNSKESFRLEVNGGNVGYYYQPNKLAISPGQDVWVEAMVRTSELNHARAMLEVSLNDDRGEIIAASRRRSELLGGPGHNDRWTAVSVLVPGRFATARFVNLSIFVLQPARWRPLDPATRDQPALIDYIDVRGKAWFDDIAVYRLPRVTMSTAQPGQLIAPEAKPAVNVCVEGFPNQPLEAVLAIYDVNNRLIGHQVFNSAVTDKAGLRLFRWAGEQLPAGLYRAELGLYAGGARLAGLPPLLRRNLMFAQLAAASSRPTRGRGFGLVVDAPAAGLDDAAERAVAEEQAQVIARLAVSLVKLPLWRTDMKLDQLDQADPWTDHLAQRLARQNVTMVATFGTIPQPLQMAAATTDAVAQNLGLRRTLLDVFASDPAVWRPFVSTPLARYAEQFRYWQIGLENTPVFALDHRFGATMDAVRKEFRAQLTAPTFAATWPATYSFRRGGAGDDESPPGAASGQAQPQSPGPKFPAEIINLFLANTLSPDSLGDYVREFVGATAGRPWATVEPLPPQDYQREPRMVDLAWRLVMAAAATDEPEAPACPSGSVASPVPAGNVFLAAPWTCRESGGGELIEPTEELLIYRTAADLLGGSKYAGTVRLADGVIGHIFDRGNGAGALAVRNLTADPATPIEMYLGEQVCQVDLWGNRQPLAAAGAKAAGGEARGQALTAGRLPFYLDNVDPRILRLRASFALDPAFVPSSYKKHVRRVQFLNGFDTPISGRLTLRFPDNWEVHPKIIQFSAQAGELFSREVEIRFPYNAEAGAKQLIGDFAIDADRAYRIEAATRFEFGLGDVDVRPLTQWLPNDELLVTMTVSNRSDGRLDLFCFVVAPDRPRQERVIAGLPAGGSATKSFRIPDARGLVGQSLRVGLREVRGSRIVNYDVPVR